ncbi:hypothetical protein [Paracoccus albus]|uniref:hypothetical protein n=1 Tax=Paracoccus albus TaxID=3017784 RepID=UPI0022F0D592|nr:hypothetical protein [Paracoccus albus]WBU60111.1 hypothetical protein PAF20_15445 [Paracoccus albus]
MPDAQSCSLQKMRGESGAAARVADTDKKVLLVMNAGQRSTFPSVLVNTVGYIGLHRHGAILAAG